MLSISRSIFILAMYLLCCADGVSAQEAFDDFFDSADPEFIEMMEEAASRFEEMRQLDSEFADILNNAWRELELSTGITADPEPKPRDIPTARPEERPELPEPVDAVPVEEPETVPEPEVTAETLSQYGVPVEFYRTLFPVRGIDSLDAKLSGAVSEQTISTYWEALSASAYEDCITQLLEVRRLLALNDWGYCMLLDHVAGTVTGSGSSEHPLLIWFLLVKSGFDARAGFAGTEVYVLLPARTTVYNIPYYEFDGIRYYLTSLGNVTPEVKSLYTYEGSYQDTAQPVDYAFPATPDISKTFYEKPVSFSYDGTRHDLTVQVNRNLIDFLDTYPQTSLEVYFAASITSETARSLAESLEPLVDGRSELDAVNLLLRFIQTGFPYKTDGDQFGREKFMFPEQTLFYPYSDCEDRSFLFAYLVTTLLDLDVVGLDYPGHVATAVRFTDPVDGTGFSHNGGRYVICDPTYINANAGECMPDYREVSPGIVSFERRD